MKNFGEGSVFKIVTTNSKIKIEVSVKDLKRLLQDSPENNAYNDDVVKVRRGKSKEFTEYIAKALIDGSDPDTGDSPVMSMFEKVFMEIFEGYEDFCKYPDEDEE